MVYFSNTALPIAQSSDNNRPLTTQTPDNSHPHRAQQFLPKFKHVPPNHTALKSCLMQLLKGLFEGSFGLEDSKSPTVGDQELV